MPVPTGGLVAQADDFPGTVTLDVDDTQRVTLSQLCIVANCASRAGACRPRVRDTPPRWRRRFPSCILPVTSAAAMANTPYWAPLRLNG